MAATTRVAIPARRFGAAGSSGRGEDSVIGRLFAGFYADWSLPPGVQAQKLAVPVMDSASDTADYRTQVGRDDAVLP